jgi:hypothetical protein
MQNARLFFQAGNNVSNHNFFSSGIRKLVKNYHEGSGIRSAIAQRKVKKIVNISDTCRLSLISSTNPQLAENSAY